MRLTIPGGAAAQRMDLHRRRQLIETVRRQFRLEWQGIHGVPHWGRVRWNGLAMARVNGARDDIVELFAFLHDSQRFHDGTDREHGARDPVLLDIAYRRSLR